VTPDPAHPWGIAVDYAGRALAPVIERGFSVDVMIRDAQPGRRDTPTVDAQILVISPDGAAAVTLATATVYAYQPGSPWQPSPAAVQAAVEQCAALAVQRLDWLASLRPAAPPTP
jgi:hypothetical protein